MYYGNVYYNYNERKEAIDKCIEYYNKQQIEKNLRWIIL